MNALPQRPSVGEPGTGLRPSSTEGPLEAHDDLAIEAAPVGFRLLLEPAVKWVWKTLDRQRRHGGSVMVPKWNLMLRGSLVKQAPA